MIRAYSLIVLILSGIIAMTFKPPSDSERLQAIGSTQGLPAVLRRALDPNLDFQPIPIPKPGDWLAEHAEAGQFFAEYVQSGPNRPDKTRNKLYLQPLGEFPQGKIPLLARWKECATAFLAMEVIVLPTQEFKVSSITTRINPYTHIRQILTSDILDLLEKKLPKDAFCVLGITMEDLYPDPSWNFVFGQASIQARVGVYSFARYDPAFYGEERGTEYEKILLRRSCKVLVHETAHMFGLQHCIFFHCVMNGSNHLEESDARPLHLCPVCLHKLQYAVDFDVVQRYGNLLRFYRTVGFDPEARWIEGRLEKISSP